MSAKYYGSIPAIAQARANNPMQQIATQALQQGASTAPVAGGGWAWADGIARALQGVTGGLANRNLDKQYAGREAEYMKQIAEAAALASNPAVSNPAASNPGVNQQQAVATALAGPQAASQADLVPQPIESFTPPASNAIGPQYGPMGGNAPPMRHAASTPFPQATDASRRGSDNDTGARQLSARDLYFTGIVPIEGGTDPKTGAFRTSPKGAIGPGQVMPGTAPEAARLAGVKFDDWKYRNDPEYNNLLGQAYYAEQLKTFGDPVKAAAAYNAGPGAVRRAVRRASKSGGSFVQYLPSETQNYVDKFTQRTSVSTETNINTPDPIGAVGPVDVVAPNYEEVQQPNRENYVPDEVQTNRIAMAQKMLASGNPDLVVMAQAYLDQGLAEQNDARTKRNQQQFEYGRGEREYGQRDYEGALGRNANREAAFDDRYYRASESAADREQRTREANQGYAFQREERIAGEAFTRERDRAGYEHEAKMESFKTQFAKDPFFDTATGQKLQVEMEDENANLDNVVSRVQRFMLLNDKQQTGGMYNSLTNPIAGVFDAEIKEMRGLANELTIDVLGGLGVAVSDGDRNFVSEAFLSPDNPKASNENRGRAIIEAARRKQDYNIYRVDWRAKYGPRGMAQFNKLWRDYAKSNELIRTDPNTNKIIVNSGGPDFYSWLESRPSFDANGNPVG